MPGNGGPGPASRDFPAGRRGLCRPQRRSPSASTAPRLPAGRCKLAPGHAGAYWDAADVVFQDRIAPLWDLVRAHPGHLLVVTEVIRCRDSTTCQWWVQTIEDPEARARAVDLFRDCDTINSGLAAGTARTMLRYLKEADGLLNSPALRGTGDWGDQTAMNLYCRSNPHTWLEIPRGWNYCLIGLGPRDYRVSPAGRTERLDGEPLHVVHGAGRTLRRWDLVHLTA